MSAGTFGGVVAALAGLSAAWIAAGSTGLLAHPLRRALILLFLGLALVVQSPIAKAGLRSRLVLFLLAVGAAAYMVTLPLAAANIMAAGVILGFLAFAATGHRRDILLASATAIVVFGLYRFAVTSVPWLWLAADSAGGGLGKMAGQITGRPVWVGATFAGLDFLVLTGALWGLYLPRTKPPRAKRAFCGFAAILGGHLIYLLLLSYIPDLLAVAPLPAEGTGAPTPALRLLHHAIPWDFPAVACGIHLLIVAVMFRWSAWAGDESRVTRSGPRPSVFCLPVVAALLTAILLPVVAVLYPGPSSLAGRKIVFYEKGFLNWLRPTHGSYGRLSSGMYGMLPVFLESLGARTLVSADLSETDLQDADALVLIFPDEPWKEDQLERIHAFVRRGGSLLVLGEHTTQDKDGSNRFNEALAPTAMQVQFDSATFAIGGWLHSYEALSHPATAGIRDDQNQFGVVIGASVGAHWPARPILVGRWGWADYGDQASTRAMMGNDRYDAGEKLGDLVLAAEQPMGKGRIVAFGDTSGLTNAINVSSYVFTSRLFGYLAGGAARAHQAWWQILALLVSVCLVGLVLWRPTAWKTALAAIGLTVSLAACTAASQGGASLLPEGRRQNPNNLAYIDASHVEAYSSESWRTDGVGGLALTLMRNGYLTLTLPEVTPLRLERAGLLISIAPARSFSRAEVETVKTFVNHGGIVIMTVGYEEAAASQSLLNAFGLRVGLAESERLEPEPLGHFKSPYLESEGKRVYVRFHAGWPVACSDAGAHVMAYGRDNRPVMIMRRLGKGAVLLIGDTCFAMNKNLEYENGAPFEGLRENADFWRWLLTVLRNEPMWVPPMLQSSPAGTPPGGASGEAGP